MTNSTFSGNDGGGIYNAGLLTVTNSTFSGNSASGSGSAIYNFSGLATVTNTIVANSTLGGNCYGAITDGGHNIDDGTTCGFAGTGCTATTGTSFCNTNPHLDPAGLQNNGGPTQTVALCTAVGTPAACTGASPAINAGNESVCSTITGTAPVANLDQRGSLRPGTGVANCSIGAFEANSAASCVVGTGTTASCTESALDACLPGGGTLAVTAVSVTFNCGGAATVTVTGTKTISADTSIDGGGLITISGGNTVGVFSVNAGVTFTVQNLTIANGNSSPEIGGGAISNGGTLNVTNSTFSGNSGGGIGGSGGAISNGGTLNVTNSTFSGNSATPGLFQPADGGAIANGGTLNVTNSTFSGNSAGSGGAIASGGDGTFTITNSTFSGNSAVDGGAIASFAAHATLNVTNSTFSGNHALDAGGAILIEGYGTLTVITNSTFSGNSAFADGRASSAGAISNNGTLDVTNVTFSGNSATDLGGAIYNARTLTVTSSTFSGNSALDGGGILNGTYWDYTPKPTATVTNSTFSSNSGGAIVNGRASPGLRNGATLTVTNSTFVSNAIDNTDNTNCGNTGRCQVTLTNTIVANSSGGNCAGTIIDGGHNLDDGTTCGFSTVNGSLSNTDPKLDRAGLQNNGGPTQTIALLPGSRAVDAGDSDVCAAEPVNGLDQRGYVRPGVNHTQCSIGAYEADAVAAPACTGDCDGKGSVTVDELITMVNIALGSAEMSACKAADANGDGRISVDELIEAVNRALSGCG